MKRFVYNNLKIIIFICMFIGAFTIKSNADTQNISNTINLCGVDVAVEYTIISNSDGTSHIASLRCLEPEKLHGELVIPKMIDGLNVHSLYNGFQNATGITGIVVPSTLKNAGYQSFKGCTNLKSIKFDEDVTTVPSEILDSCEGIEEVVIPNHITELGSYCFRGCPNLKKVTLSKNLVMMGVSNFENCTSLTSMNIPKSLGNTDGSIGHNSFKDCINLKEFTFEEGITRIPPFLFSGCNCLEEIILPDTIVKVDSYAFDGCSSLKEIELPKAVKDIGIDVFDDCTSLEKITIYDNVGKMGWIPELEDLPRWAENGLENMFSNHSDKLTVYCYKGSFADEYAKMIGLNTVYMTKEAPTPTGELNVQNYVRNNTGNNIVVNVSNTNQVENRSNNVVIKNKIVDNRIVAADVNNRTDNTLADSILPYTGHNVIALLLGLALLVIVPILYIRVSKYKEI